MLDANIAGQEILLQQAADVRSSGLSAVPTFVFGGFIPMAVVHKRTLYHKGFHNLQAHRTRE
jgi:hypothetical protein